MLRATWSSREMQRGRGWGDGGMLKGGWGWALQKMLPPFLRLFVIAGKVVTRMDTPKSGIRSETGTE